MSLFQNVRLASFAVLVAVGAGVIWWVQYGKNGVLPVSAKELRLPQNEQLQQSFKDVDNQVAQLIRSKNIPHFSLESIPLSLPKEVSGMGNATVSATFTTTPAEFWQDVREKGAQAAVGSVVTQAKVQAGEVSADILNEARYQYCKGVVTNHESAVKAATP